MNGIIINNCWNEFQPQQENKLLVFIVFKNQDIFKDIKKLLIINQVVRLLVSIINCKLDVTCPYFSNWFKKTLDNNAKVKITLNSIN